MNLIRYIPSVHGDSLIFQTRAHHVQLSSMADVKASMLITMSSIALTLAVPRVQHAGTHWALHVLMASCLLTILLAAYAVMPKFRGPVRPAPDARQLPRFNILFFGDFTGMSYPDFKKEITEVVNDPHRLYEVQLREIHSLGVYLARTKYRYLRMAYVSFMGGLVASFITLLIAD